MINAGFVAAHLAALGICLLLAIVDIREHRLPNRLVTKLFAAAIVTGLIGLAGAGTGSHLIDALWGVAGFAGPCLVLHLVSPRLMGFGDVKLAIVLGLFVGWHNPWAGFIALYGAFVLAFPESLWRLVTRRRERPNEAISDATAVASTGANPVDESNYLAFGPYLIAAAALALIVNFTSV